MPDIVVVFVGNMVVAVAFVLKRDENNGTMSGKVTAGGGVKWDNW